MSKRERLEDLGMILVKLEQMAECDLFRDLYTYPKGFRDWFSKRTDEEKADFMYALPCWIYEASSILDECIVIARGHHE